MSMGSVIKWKIRFSSPSCEALQAGTPPFCPPLLVAEATSLKKLEAILATGGSVTTWEYPKRSLASTLAPQSVGSLDAQVRS